MIFLRILLIHVFSKFFLIRGGIQEISIKYKEVDQFCLSKSSCDGTEKNPSGSLLDSFFICFRTGEDCLIKLKDETYNLTDTESNSFFNTPRESLLFSNEVSNLVKNLILEGGSAKYVDGNIPRTLLILYKTYFSLSLKNLVLTFRNIDLVFYEPSNVNRLENFFIYLAKAVIKSEINLINTSMLLNQDPTQIASNRVIIYYEDTSDFNIDINNFSLKISGGYFS